MFERALSLNPDSATQHRKTLKSSAFANGPGLIGRFQGNFRCLQRNLRGFGL
jgi:hypothetical protein